MEMFFYGNVNYVKCQIQLFECSKSHYPDFGSSKANQVHYTAPYSFNSKKFPDLDVDPLKSKNHIVIGLISKHMKI